MNLLHAGIFSVNYHQGFLRYISIGDTEILRMIYFALRDHNWSNVPHRIINEIIDQTNDSFKINYECIHTSETIEVLHWKVSIEGKPDGTIVFQIIGTVLKDFKKNRAGFCVLHPLKDVLNAPCEITHPNKTKTTGNFPTQIHPVNPFKNIRSMRWQAKNEWFIIDFEGDIFETEDQRNWCDASFKTFCTPLDIPFPAMLKLGQQINQKIVFKPEKKISRSTEASDIITIKKSDKKFIIPQLGIGASTETTDLSENAITLLKKLKTHHYRVEVYPAKENWVPVFSRDCENGFKLDLPLEVALHLTKNFKDEAEAFVQLCLQNRVRLIKVLLLSDGEDVTNDSVMSIVPYLKHKLPKVLFGVGTDYNFTEINRNRFKTKSFDFIGYSLNPQEHSSDDLSLIENLEAQYHTVKSTQMIYGESTPVHVSPITLRKRFNPYATNLSDLVKNNEEKADPRQISKFCAVWTFGSICAMSSAGAHTVTYYQTIGSQGLISLQDIPYEVYYVLEQFSLRQGSHGYILESNKPLHVQGLLFENGETAFVNFTDKSQKFIYNNKLEELKPFEIRWNR